MQDDDFCDLNDLDRLREQRHKDPYKFAPCDVCIHISLHASYKPPDCRKRGLILSLENVPLNEGQGMCPDFKYGPLYSAEIRTGGNCIYRKRELIRETCVKGTQWECSICPRIISWRKYRKIWKNMSKAKKRWNKKKAGWKKERDEAGAEKRARAEVRMESDEEVEECLRQLKLMDQTDTTGILEMMRKIEEIERRHDGRQSMES